MGDEDLHVLCDCLCDSCIEEDKEIVIYMMKEYQVEQSWTVVYKLSTSDFEFDFGWDYVC